MSEHEPISPTSPLFSVVISVFNDWALLDRCLQSLARQSNRADFEVVIVDDGSDKAAPASIRSWRDFYPLTVISQSHAGISAARNQGVRNSKGAVLVFVDADCIVLPDSFAALSSTVAQFPQYDSFQMHLMGDGSGLVGRAEELRLASLQNQMLQPDGRIRYLNTSGFAIRRAAVDIEKGVFDPVALRAEDTLLLATLMKRGELPLFISNAGVQHAIPLSLIECLRKDLRSVSMVENTYEIIASMGVSFRLTHRERLSMLWAMWKTSRRDSIGRLAWFVVTGRRALGFTASIAYRCFRGFRPKSAKV